MYLIYLLAVIGFLSLVKWWFTKFPIWNDSEMITAKREAEALRNWMKNQFAKLHKEIEERASDPVMDTFKEAYGLNEPDALDAEIKELLDKADAEEEVLDYVRDWLTTAPLDKLQEQLDYLRSSMEDSQLACGKLEREINRRLTSHDE